MKKTIFSLMAVVLISTFSCKDESKKSTSEDIIEVVEVNIKGETVTYATDSTTMKGYIAFDENNTEKRPGILVIHEWWGHNDYVRERADMLAELGYVALAVDMYGDGKQADHPDDAGKFAGMVMQNMEEATARFNAALELLKSNPNVDAEKIAAIGYCFGGSVALSMANAGSDLDAVAAFHSGVALPVMPSDQLKARVLVCNGADDPFASSESIETFKKQMDSINADYKYVAYPGAVHAFTSKDADALGEKFNLPLAYNKEADEKSWEELQILLTETFK
ncbi:dienelactone hydrolase family protein [Paucihalobacter ruber]|uniref:Dienelactone hydrolase family protein n=1 Tax=Paucihalobacter ruber TaxID=2567861 RepID=A0A506PCC3_9FLAO|nr:dienelactone hydrolase family protein [Paucihalobacter ruber]TPV31476.1 dienelactone hydrolase family protein [Paucihalobacter ruber]